MVTCAIKIMLVLSSIINDFLLWRYHSAPKLWWAQSSEFGIFFIIFLLFYNIISFKVISVACFDSPVLIELPHVASLHNNEREVIAMRSNDGISWSEHPTAPQDLIDQINQSAAVPSSGRFQNYWEFCQWMTNCWGVEKLLPCGWELRITPSASFVFVWTTYVVFIDKRLFILHS